MQFPKVLLSWISGILILLGALMEAIPVVFCEGTVCTPDTPAGRIIVLLGLVVMSGRNLLKDRNNDGIPDILQAAEDRAVTTATDVSVRVAEQVAEDTAKRVVSGE